jgi:hypothetical protein
VVVVELGEDLSHLHTEHAVEGDGRGVDEHHVASELAGGRGHL